MSAWLLAARNNRAQEDQHEYRSTTRDLREDHLTHMLVPLLNKLYFSQWGVLMVPLPSAVTYLAHILFHCGMTAAAAVL
jgi:hypothetical protein